VELLEQLEREHDNLRAALEWMENKSQVESGLRLAGALWRFWDVRGYLSEGRKWLEAFLSRADGSASTAIRAKATTGAGVLAGTQGDFAHQDVILEESLRLYRELGDNLGIAQALNNLGSIAYSRGEWQRASGFYAESLALRRELGDKWGIANSLNNLGGVAYSQGDYEKAARLYSESLALRRELGDRRGIGMSLNNLGEVAQQQGDHAQAAELFRQSLEMRRELGDKIFIVSSLSNLGEVASDMGDYERAAKLFGAAESLREEIGSPVPLAKRHEYERRVAVACADLGKHPFEGAWEEGRGMSLEHVIGYALDPTAKTVIK
jgi:non-specific serine/threonine protein kinase